MCIRDSPTGTILKKSEIERILKETEARVLVDETYIEFTDMETFSSSSLTKSYDKLIVVRGTSKFFALPGIRLGYGLTSNHGLLKFFKDKEVLWQINSVAEICGKVMFSDEAYIKEVHDFVRTRRVGLYKKLAKIKNLRAFESYGNFVLVKILRGPDARELRGRLMKKGLVVRNCDTFKNLDKSFFRFCILDDDANERLIENLREIYQEVK